MKQKWGKDYAGNYSRIKELVGQVNGEYLAYKGKPILAAYHEISSGVTERGENIWEGKFPTIEHFFGECIGGKAQRLNLSLTADFVLCVHHFIIIDRDIHLSSSPFWRRRLFFII